MKIQSITKKPMSGATIPKLYYWTIQFSKKDEHRLIDARDHSVLDSHSSHKFHLFYGSAESDDTFTWSDGACGYTFRLGYHQTGIPRTILERLVSLSEIPVYDQDKELIGYVIFEPAPAIRDLAKSA